MEESTIEQEGNEEAERKRWSQQCHAGRKALPWHFANQTEGWWWWGGYTAEERRGENGPEGYRCWIAPALDTVKERKQEIWGKVNLSLTPWPTTMCYPLQEASQTERDRGEARERAGDCLTSSCQKREEKMNRNERRCTRPVDITTLSMEKTQKACKAVRIKDMIIQLLSHSVAITQLDLYLQCTNDSFSFTLFILPDNHLSIPLTLTFSHTLAPSHPHPIPPPLSSIRPQHSDLAPAVSHWSLW